MARLAIHRDSRSETNDAPKPQIAQMIEEGPVAPGQAEDAQLAQDGQDDRDHHHDGDVGQDEEEDALHHGSSP